MPEEVNVEEEVTRIKNQVVSSLIQFDRGIWSCKACLYECSVPNRIRDHILNHHFNGPLSKCEFCETYCKNESALKRHINRQHKAEKRMKESENDWHRIKERARAATQSDNECSAPNISQCPSRPPAVGGVTPGQNTNIPGNIPTKNTDTETGITSCKVFSLTETITNK